MADTKITNVVIGLATRKWQPNACLMTKRAENVKRPNMWEYPGGKQEPDETLEAALKREWREELGCDAKIGPCLDVAQFVLTETFNVYLFAVITEEPKVNVCWVTPDEAVEKLPCVPSTYVFYPSIKLWLDYHDCLNVPPRLSHLLNERHVYSTRVQSVREWQRDRQFAGIQISLPHKNCFRCETDNSSDVHVV